MTGNNCILTHVVTATAKPRISRRRRQGDGRNIKNRMRSRSRPNPNRSSRRRHRENVCILSSLVIPEGRDHPNSTRP